MRSDKMRIVVTGAAGRLGTTMAHELALAGHAVSPLTHAALDVTVPEIVERVIRRLRPDVIVNCSAYNAVDAAERDPVAAYAVNAQAPAALASAAATAGAVLVHFGTDFVFDGNATEPYPENAAPNPLNVYGASKLAGEIEVRQLPQHYILRVESLFGGRAAAGQRATVDFIAESLAAGIPVRAIVDRTVTPSYVGDVVRVTRALIESSAPFGTYHCVASGTTTWYELANEIAVWLDVPARVVPMQASELSTPAVRPRYCALSNQKLLALGIDLPAWRTTILRHLAARHVVTRTPALQARIA